MELLKIVKAAKNQDLCTEWYEDFLHDHSLKHLCERYFEGLDWAIEKDFPNLEILRYFIGRSDAYGIHTDYSGTIENDSNSLKRHAFFGQSSAEFIAGDFSVSELVVRHDSQLKIKANGNAYLIVNVLDKAHVEIETEGESKVDVYQYGQSAVIQEVGNVKINKKW